MGAAKMAAHTLTIIFSPGTDLELLFMNLARGLWIIKAFEARKMYNVNLAVVRPEACCGAHRSNLTSHPFRRMDRIFCRFLSLYQKV